MSNGVNGDDDARSNVNFACAVQINYLVNVITVSQSFDCLRKPSSLLANTFYVDGFEETKALH